MRYQKQYHSQILWFRGIKNFTDKFECQEDG